MVTRDTLLGGCRCVQAEGEAARCPGGFAETPWQTVGRSFSQSRQRDGRMTPSQETPDMATVEGPLAKAAVPSHPHPGHEGTSRRPWGRVWRAGPEQL